MPSYEYRCKNCQRRFEIVMTYQEYGQRQVSCPHCHSDQVERRIGRIRLTRMDEARMEDLMDPAKMGDFENDPKAMGRMMRRMSSELGEDMGPEFSEMVNRLESGQSPEEIESSMPELADEIGRRSSMDDGPMPDLGD